MEYWKNTEFDNYEVSNTGKVRNKTTKKILKPVINTWGGYLTATMYDNGKIYKRLIHRLVCIAFVENPNNYNTADHIDRCITNNCSNNLRWVSKSDNFKNSNKYDEAKRIIERTRIKKNGETYTYYEVRKTINGKKYANCFSKYDDAQKYLEEINSM